MFRSLQEGLVQDKAYSIEDFNDNIEAKQIIQLLNGSEKNLVISGMSGTGKSTLMRCLVDSTRKKGLLLSADHDPYGFTIFNFFNFYMCPFWFPTDEAITNMPVSAWEARYVKSLDYIIIDDAFDMYLPNIVWVEKLLRKIRDNYKPFGGVQMVYCGDYNRLSNAAAPIVPGQKLFFFESFAYAKMPHLYIELKRNYVYNDPGFLDILEYVRMGDEEMVDILNNNIRPGSQTTPMLEVSEDFRYVQAGASHTQIQKYELLPSNSVQQGIHRELDLSITVTLGSKVWFTADYPETGIKRGDVGIVTSVGDHKIEIELPDGQMVSVDRRRWTFTMRSIDDERRKTGSWDFSQYPIRAVESRLYLRKAPRGINHSLLVKADCFRETGRLYTVLLTGTRRENFVFETHITKKDLYLHPAIKALASNFQSLQSKGKIQDELARIKYRQTMKKGRTGG